MKFRIERQIFKDFDRPFIGVVIARSIDNTNSNPEIVSLIRKVEEKLREGLSGMEITEHPHIVPWREAYRKFGAKPRDYRCSAEALSRIVLKGVEIKNINDLVNLYNLISLKYILPVGAEDLDKMEGDLVLGFAKGDENYIPLGEEENDPPQKREVIYRDDLGVICRRWNWREGDRTKITKETKNAIVVVESLAPIDENLAKQATEELVELIQKYCGGRVNSYFLNENQREIQFDF